jgi:hypothetical protein
VWGHTLSLWVAEEKKKKKIKTNLEILKYTLPRRPYLPVLFPTQPSPGQERPFDEKA